ncbi:hypothetical protein Lser_V15G40326 [Lactuca serriola]
MEVKKWNSRRVMKICCVVATLLLIIFLLISVILFFTVFKPKNPKVTTHPTSLENVEFQLYPNVSINATIVLNVTISNRNHGSFKFQNSIAYVDYRGTLIAEIPIEHAKIPAHGNFTITAYANVTTEKMVTDPNFYNDMDSGYFNFTSTAILYGDVSVFKIIKKGAKVTNICNIIVALLTRKVESKCHAKVKIHEWARLNWIKRHKFNRQVLNSIWARLFTRCKCGDIGLKAKMNNKAQLAICLMFKVRKTEVKLKQKNYRLRCSTLDRVKN